MLGFIVSAVSPAVVVPSLLKLKEQHYGIEKGIPDLVLAAASFDDVLSISGFGICLGLSFDGENNIVFDVFRAPLEIVIGIVSGIFFAKVCAYVTSSVVNNKVNGDNNDCSNHVDMNTVNGGGQSITIQQDDCDTKSTNKQEVEGQVNKNRAVNEVIVKGNNMVRLISLLGFGGLVFDFDFVFCSEITSTQLCIEILKFS